MYAILLLCLSTAPFITLLSYNEHFYIADLCLILSLCSDGWSIPYLITLLSNCQIPIHCWAMPNPNTLFTYTLPYYIAKLTLLHYRTDEWSKQLLRLKSWVISGNPEQWMEVHPSVKPRCTRPSATTLYNLLHYLIRSILCLIIRHDVIINESLKSDYLSL